MTTRKRRESCLWVQDLGALAPGDTFEIGGVIYEVRGEPLRDALRHVWKAEAREA
ncbi:head-tail joining protein [Tabrizicola sp.]|uniref:head-tail joining protein n=1 Tax=Tabrizicola sp. TaxID=2005166 RepID=UPI003FCE6B1B